MNETVEESAQRAVGDKAEAFEKELKAVKTDIAHLAQQISDAVNTLSSVAQNQTRRGLKQARSNVGSAVSDASDRAGAMANAAQAAASSVGETLGDVIQQRPVATVALALGLGFLFGVTWRR